MRRVTLGASLLLGVLGAAGLAQAQVNQLGEMCWQVQGGTAGNPEESRWRLGVMSYGAGHFVVSGRVTRVPSGVIEPIHGNAEVAGGTVLMTLASSEAASVSGTRESATINVIMTLATLSGEYNKIGFEGLGTFGELLTDEGRLNPVPCP